MGSQIDLRWTNDPPSTNEFEFGALLELDTGPLLGPASEKRAMGDDTPCTGLLPELVFGVHVDKRACIHHRRDCECAQPGTSQSLYMYDWGAA